MQSFNIYLDLYNGDEVIDSILIQGGGMPTSGGTRQGTYSTKSQSTGTWKIRSIVIEQKHILLTNSSIHLEDGSPTELLNPQVLKEKQMELTTITIR